MKNEHLVLLYAHDPGGADCLLTCIPALQRCGYAIKILADGPALQKFKAAGFGAEPFEAALAVWSPGSVYQWLNAQPVQAVITGTSANACGEKYLWQAARELGIPSVALLDQWLNYGIRFAEEGLATIDFYRQDPKHPYLPDAVAVMDDLARRELLVEVPELAPERIWVVGFHQAEQIIRTAVNEGVNHNMDDTPVSSALGQTDTTLLQQQSRANKSTPSSNNTTTRSVWMSEPLTEMYGKQSPMGYSEFDALEAVLNELHAFGSGMTQPHAFWIKLHPKEAPDKYVHVLRRYGAVPVDFKILGTDFTVRQAIAEADVVWGMASMALIEAALMDKPVISVQPNLQGTDPLVLSRMGWVDSCVTHQQLVTACYDVFVDNNWLPYRGRFALPWPREAGQTGQRVVDQLTQLVASRIG